jgi:hypothetical protein
MIDRIWKSRYAHDDIRIIFATFNIWFCIINDAIRTLIDFIRKHVSQVCWPPKELEGISRYPHIEWNSDEKVEKLLSKLQGFYIPLVEVYRDDQYFGDKYNFLQTVLAGHLQLEVGHCYTPDINDLLNDLVRSISSKKLTSLSNACVCISNIIFDSIVENTEKLFCWESQLEMLISDYEKLVWSKLSQDIDL